MKMTQRQVAESVGLHQSSISLFLRGKKRPSWPTAKKLAKVLGCEPTEIMEDTPGCIRKALEVDNS